MPDPSLEEVQRWMISRILPPERSGAAGMEVELNPQAGEPGAERLSVYSGGYLARMQFIETNLPSWMKLNVRESAGSLDYPNGSRIEAVAGGANQVRGERGLREPGARRTLIADRLLSVCVACGLVLG